MPQATIMRPHCPHCGGATIHPRGSKQRPGRFQCADCKKYFVDRGSPKVLVFDIETLPIIGTFWDTGKQYIGHNNIMEDWVVLSWSAKSLFDSNTIGDILTPGEIKRRLNTVIDPNPDPHYADERIVRRMWKLIDEADVVIHQNGKKFDMRKLNARFVYYGLPPYRPVHQIDTLIAAQAAFGTSSHKLDYMTKFLSLERKRPTDYELWTGSMYGDPASLKEMYDYGLNDTTILEEYYARIRAWIPNHPNFSAYTNSYVDAHDEVSCPVCRHPIHKSHINGTYRTALGNEYDSFRCPHCGAVGRKNKKRPGRPEVRSVQ
jgi:predicted RNA-binding Zn-ribbon protein involved in translation (DUF1610 family)